MGNWRRRIFYEQLAQLAAELYFHAAGTGVTAGLREIFHTLNRDLYEHNLASNARYEAQLICAVLRRDELILGRVGQALAAYQLGDQLNRFPENFHNPVEMKRVPLGAHPIADLRMTRFPVREGARLLLGGSGLAEMNAAAIRAALRGPDLTETLQQLQKDAPPQLHILGCEFLPVEADTADDIPLSRSSAEEPQKAPAARLPLEKPARQGAARGLRRLAAAFRLGSRATERVLGQPETESDSWLSFTTAVLAVVIVPIAVVALVFFLWYSGTNRSALEICLEDAGEIYQVALRVEANDLRGWRVAWQALLDTVEDCDSIAPGDDTLAHYRSEAQANLDVLNYVSRQETRLLATMPGAQLSDIILRNRNLFVLDRRGDTQVYHMTLSEDGRSLTGVPEPLPYLRGRAQLGEHAVGQILDIDWSEEALGFGNENVIVGLDENGLLVDCLLSFLSQCQGQQLQRSEQWQSPNAMYIWDGRLYILDPTLFQIWRYEPSGGAYHDVPTEYFTGQGLPNIDEAVDFEITRTGDLFVLRSDGVLLKFRGGIEQLFGLLAFPRLPVSADGLFIDESSLDSAIYVADSDARSVIKMSLGGSFIADFRLTQERALAELRDLAVDARLGLIYAIAGDSIYVFPSS